MRETKPIQANFRTKQTVSDVGKLHHKCSTFSPFRVYGNVSAVQTDNLLRQRHADAVSLHHLFFFSSIKQSEKVLLVDIRHTDATVRQADNSPFIPERNLDRRGVIGGVFAVVLYQVGKAIFSRYGFPVTVIRRSSSASSCPKSSSILYSGCALSISSLTSSNSSSSRTSRILISSFR